MKLRSLFATLLIVLLVAGCSRPSLNALPAAGGVSGPTYTLTAEFDDTLNLVTGARVKLDGAVVGQVQKIETKDYRAVVTFVIKQDVKVPRGSVAQVRFTTPLGEDFVAITAPKDKRAGDYEPGQVVPLKDTDSAPTIEDTFAALSIVLNGGGLDDLGTIIREINQTLDGREPIVRDTLVRINDLVGRFDARKSEFMKLLDNLHGLAKTLSAGTVTIDEALTKFPVAFDALAQDTDRLLDLVKQVGSLSTVTKRVVDRTSGAVIGAMDSLHPVLQSFVARRDDLLPTLQALLKFGGLLQNAAPGDYLNLTGTVAALWEQKAFVPNTAAITSTNAETVTSLLGGAR